MVRVDLLLHALNVCANLWMLAESEKVQIVNVSNRNLVDHHMKGIEHASCFETRHLVPEPIYAGACFETA